MSAATPRALLAAAVLLLTASQARAAAEDWKKAASSGGDQVILVSVSAPDAKNVFAAGTFMDVSTGLPKLNPRVLASADAGRTWTDASGNLGALAFTTLSAVSFVDGNRGWVAGGKKVWSTVNAGAAWVAGTEAGIEVNALHFADVKRGFAGGVDGVNVAVRLTADGGKTWTAPATMPTLEGEVRSFFWLSEKVGWAACSSTQTIDDGGQGYDAPKEGFTLSTTDGGATWTASTTRVANYALGPVHFLRDGATGWAAAYMKEDANRANAALYKTTDGGKTWTDAKIPLNVGKFSMMGITGDINVSFFHTLFFSGDKLAHLGGNVYVADTDDGSGQTVHVYRNVDFWTHDGTTWERTDLGTIAMTGTMPNDGILATGAMTGLAQGWMVGEKSLAYYYEPAAAVPCTSEADCAPGFGCNPFGKCQAVTCPDGCPEGQVCSWQVCRTPPDAGAPVSDSGQILTYDDAGNPVTSGDGGGSATVDGGHPGMHEDAGTGGGGGAGCGCGAGAGAMPALGGLALVLWAMGTRRIAVRSSLPPGPLRRVLSSRSPLRQAARGGDEG